jgi:hypothetical protein
MTRNLRTDFAVFALCAFLSVPASLSSAATILKLNLGGTGPDVSMDAGGVFSTTSDGNAATTGDQDTAVEFTDFLDGSFVDIPTSIASFSISGVGSVGAPSVGGGTVNQNFFGGSIKLYGPAPMNELLLDANLQDSAVFGTLGMPGIGGFFTVTLGTATAGTILPYITPGSIGLSMPLTDINGGTGLLVMGNVLQPFTSDASANITADPVPEPATGLLALIAASMSAAVSLRRRRRS